MDLVTIASFDIGKKNFAFLIEEFDRNALLNLKDIPEKKRYNPNGTPTESFAILLNKICTNGKTILHRNYDLTTNCDKKSYLDPEIYQNMYDVLDEHSELFDNCLCIIIEEQMSFGKNKTNTMAVKLGQHCYSYFTYRYRRFKYVSSFPAYHKTQVLGAPKKEKKTKKGKITWKTMEKKDRKKWAVKKAIEILKERGEEKVLQGIKGASKKDDLADVLVQLQAYKYLTFVSKVV